MNREASHTVSGYNELEEGNKRLRHMVLLYLRMCPEFCERDGEKVVSLHKLNSERSSATSPVLNALHYFKLTLILQYEMI